MIPFSLVPDLDQRSVNPERMDDPRLEAGQHDRALRGLARLNWIGRARAMLWPFIEREIESGGGKPLTLLDVACGRGDLLRALHRKSRGRLVCRGVDLSEHALSLARRVAPAEIRFEKANALLDPLPGADIILSSLFLHHLPDADCVSVLAKMRRAAKRLVLISDLERGRFSYWGVGLAARLVTRSSVVHVDSALSVRAAFTPRELEAFAIEAGLETCRVFRRFPCRLILIGRPTAK